MVKLSVKSPWRCPRILLSTN